MTVAYWFDLDGTLLGYDRSFASMLEAALDDELDEAVHETFRRRLFVAFDEFEDDPYRLGFEAIAEEHDIPFDPAERAEAFRTIELQSTRLVTGAKQAIEVCKTRGLVGILTNGEGRMQGAKLEHHGLVDLVDTIVISNEVGVRKPDPAIFEEAASRVDAGTHVYIGDTYEEDIQPALDAGFVPVHIRNDEGPPLSIDTVGSLVAILGGVEAH